jgi:hypothetical protein
METIDLNKLTPQQRIQLAKELEEAKKAEKQAEKVQRETYKILVSDTVTDVFKPLVGLSKHILNIKKLVFDSFDAIIEMKEEIYGVKQGQQSHTFTDTSSTISVKIGYRVTDGYDDTFSTGIEKVKNYMARLTDTEGAEKFRKILSALLRTDAKGNLKPSRVMELRQYANEEQDEELNDGVRIIEESYKPVKSCQFVEVKFKDDNNKWHSLPLSISAFDLEDEPVADTEEKAPEVKKFTVFRKEECTFQYCPTPKICEKEGCQCKQQN